MNDVRPTQLPPQLAAVKSAPSHDPVDRAGKTGTAESGNVLPEKDNSNNTKIDVNASEQSEQVRDLKGAVADINDYVQQVKRDLQFSIDDDSGRTVIRVTDRASGELIRQIPEDIFLQLARNLKNDEPIHLVNAHG